MSVATVSCPAVIVCNLSGVQSAAATVPVESDESDELDPQPAATAASAAARTSSRNDLDSGRITGRIILD